MHPSFQSSTYTHAFQSQIHGPSNLKIFDGEDLSTSWVYIASGDRKRIQQLQSDIWWRQQ
jgi:hypothetical protein